MLETRLLFIGWEREVLSRIEADYRDPSRRLVFGYCRPATPGVRDLYDGVFIHSDTPAENVRDWIGTPHLRICHDEAELRLEVDHALGIPEPLEIERKFLIAKPDTAWLESQPDCRRIPIVQTYLTYPDGSRTRIRKRDTVYYQTTKIDITPTVRTEVERRLTESEYTAMLNSADTEKRQLAKDRFCHLYDGQYFEIDVYPFWEDKAMVELEMADEANEPRFPEWMEVIREVTDDKAYRNSSLATKI